MKIEDAINNSLNEVSLRQNKENNIVIPTGFPSFDDVVGLRRGDLVVIGSAPAVGKTTLALNIARTASVDFHIPTVIFSLENSVEEISRRLILVSSDLSRSQYEGNATISSDDWKEAKKSLSVIADAPFFIDNPWRLTLDELKERTGRMVKETGVVLVVIDFIQMLQCRQGVNISDDTEMSFVLESLKDLAQEHNIAVLAMSSIDTDGMPEILPEPRFISSRSVENYVDVLGILNRRLMDEDFKDAHLSIERNVHGSLIDVSLDFNPQKFLFKEKVTDLIEISGREYL